MRAAIGLVVLLFLSVSLRAADYPVPQDAPSVNVTQPPFNAVGDGKTDCTDAFNAAIKAARKGGHGFLYVPNGTYLVGGGKPGSDSALVSWAGQKKITLWGQSREKTILRLKDNSPAFGDAQKPRWVLEAGKAGSNDFFNGLHNLTVDTGSGNPGAKAVKFHTSNQGSITNVLIRSGDGAGVIGLDLSAAGPGPGLARDIRVEGFDTGISIVYMSGFSMVFENIHLENQRRVGFYNERLPCSIRNLTSRNSVPALRVANSDGFVVLTDATLEGGAADAAAIENLKDGGLLVRNARVSGYGTGIRSTVGGSASTVAPGAITQWTSHPVRSCLPDAAARGLNLPVEDAPDVAWGDPSSDWISVRSFQPRKVNARVGNKTEIVEDWAPAIQSAIDSGKRVVYFPNGEYRIARTVVVRGNVQRLMGMQSLIGGVVAEDSPAGQSLALSEVEAMAASAEVSADDEEEETPAATLQASYPGFRIEAGAGPVVFEDLISTNGKQINQWFEHASDRTLVVRRCSLGGYRNSVPGAKVFFEDTVISNLYFDRQKVWMRQWNPEAKGANRYNCINSGSDLWILGLKTEGPKVVITTLAGGRTEVLGGYVYPNRGSEGNPAFVCVDGQQSLSYSMGDGWVSPDALYEEQVREVRGEKTYSLWRGDIFKRGGLSVRTGGLFVPLYVGYQRAAGDAALPAPSDAAERVSPAAPAAAAHLTPEQKAMPQAFARGGLGRTGNYAVAPLRAPAAAPIWKIETQKGAGVAVVCDGTAYFGDHRGKAWGVELKTGHVRWTAQLGSGDCGPAAVAYGLVYMGSGDGMYAVNAGDGSIAWQVATGSMTCYEPAVIDGRVLFVNAEGWLFSVNALDGGEHYRVRLGREPASGVAVADGTAYIGLRGGVQAVSIVDGAPLWRFRCGGSVSHLMLADGRVFSPAERIFALDARTGAEVWSGKYFKPTDTKAAYADGKLYLGAPWAKGLFVVDASTGKLLQTFHGKYSKYSWPLAVMNGPAIAGDVIYFHQQNLWHMAALDRESGKQLFTVPGFGPKSTCVPAEGHVLCAAAWSGLHTFGAGK